MKKTPHLAWAALLATTPLLSMAAGTITFNGKVTEQTCFLGTGNNDKDVNVLMPAVGKGQLTSLGQTAGYTPFKLKISGCSGAAVAVNTVFYGAALEGDRLKNIEQSDAAANVAIELLHNHPTGGLGKVDLSAYTTVSTGEQTPTTAAETAEFEFAAQYYAIGAATAGNVQATLNYDITYN